MMYLSQSNNKLIINIRLVCSMSRSFKKYPFIVYDADGKNLKRHRERSTRRKLNKELMTSASRNIFKKVNKVGIINYGRYDTKESFLRECNAPCSAAYDKFKTENEASNAYERWCMRK